MGGIHSREIISPEAELRDRQQSREEDTDLNHGKTVDRGIEENKRHQEKSRDLEHSQQTPSANDPNRQKRQDEPARQPSHFLEKLHLAHHLLLHWPSEVHNFRQARDDARNMLNGPERRPITARKHQGSDERGLAIDRTE